MNIFCYFYKIAKHTHEYPRILIDICRNTCSRGRSIKINLKKSFSEKGRTKIQYSMCHRESKEVHVSEPTDIKMLKYTYIQALDCQSGRLSLTCFLFFPIYLAFKKNSFFV